MNFPNPQYGPFMQPPPMPPAAGNQPLQAPGMMPVDIQMQAMPQLRFQPMGARWEALLAEAAIPPNANTWNNVHAPQQPAHVQPQAYTALFEHFMQDVLRNRVPVGEQDEDVLINALKRGRGERVTARVAIDGLHGKNQHSAAAWKDYFLDHLDRILPQLDCHDAAPNPPPANELEPIPANPPPPQPPPRPPQSREAPLSWPAMPPSIRGSTHTRHARSRATLVKPAPPKTPKQPLVLRPALPASSQASSSRLRIGPLQPSKDIPELKTTTSASTKRTVPARGRPRTEFDSLARAGPSSPRVQTSSTQRSRRGDPAADVHGGIIIPPWTETTAPPPPRADPDEDTSYSARRFTNADKIWFIHILRWLLEQNPRLDKEELCDEIARRAEQSPQRWLEHWAREPRLPDEILIAAQKRRDGSIAQLARTPAPDYRESSSTPSASQSTSSCSHAASSSSSPSGMATRGPGVPVTQQDLRDMAEYKYARREMWHLFGKRNGPWVEFAKQNTRRSLNAWYNAARDRAQALEEAYEQVVAEREATANSAAVAGSPSQPAGTSARASASTMRPRRPFPIPLPRRVQPATHVTTSPSKDAAEIPPIAPAHTVAPEDTRLPSRTQSEVATTQDSPNVATENADSHLLIRKRSNSVAAQEAMLSSKRAKSAESAS